MRIARQAYKAVYFAWDYHYAGGSTVGDAIETEILGKVMPWLTAADVDWLSEVPDQGNLAADTGSQTVQVTLNSKCRQRAPTGHVHRPVKRLRPMILRTTRSRSR